jgi:hypothetical protein
MEMKAKALASVDISDLHQRPPRSGALPSLMAFLKGLQGGGRRPRYVPRGPEERVVPLARGS